MKNQVNFMKEALLEAKIAYENDYVPIGCVITHENEIVARGHNGPFWHAEILTIQKAQEKLGKFLYNCQIFVTVQPCSMCLHAIKLARIAVLFYGAQNELEPLPEVEIIDGICEIEAKNLIQNFFKSKRN